MTQLEIIARQQRLLREFSAATAERSQVEKYAEAQHEEAVRDTSTRAEAARSEVQTIHKRTQKLAVDAGRQTRLPAPASVPTDGQRNPLSELRNSVEQATRALDHIDNAVYSLRVFREERVAARVRVIVVATVVLLSAMMAFAVWISEQRAQATATAQAMARATASAEAQATATAQAQQAQATTTAEAQATATAQVQQTQATATTEAQATATAQVQQTQPMTTAAEALAREAPSLAFAGVSRNADWNWVWRDFDGVLMALVPAGCFNREGYQVCFEEPFWIDVYEVTNEQFERLGGVAAQSSSWEEPQRPRENTTWEEAQVFCQQRGARLPTEAEWEYAARGPDALAYPWGNEFVAVNVVYNDNSQQRTWDVGSRPGGASWVGALDMSGNVWEWVNDWYAGDYYSRSPQVNPQGPSLGENRVLRGGSWSSYTYNLRVAFRGWLNPGYRFEYFGFRCALSH